MYTQYMFNKLAFNPATAGSNDHLSLNLLHRQQWIGIEGAPSTQVLSGHMPIMGDKVGVGATLVHDKAGPTEVFSFSMAYAYRMKLGNNLKLAVGLQAGMTDWHGDWFNIAVEQGSDPAFQHNFSRYMLNVGAGAYLTGKRFYIGFGCPQILEHHLRNTDDQSHPAYSSLYRHFYTMAGLDLPFRSRDIVFKPSILIKSAGFFSGYQRDLESYNVGAPNAVDLDFAFYFYRTLWVGTGYRSTLQRGISSDDSIDLWAAVQLRSGLRLGAAYDLTLSKLRKISSGSFEVMIGYEFDIKVRQMNSPRYF
jgi:type IX secretion system PorP/SprF family membrane protein